MIGHSFFDGVWIILKLTLQVSLVAFILIVMWIVLVEVFWKIVDRLDL